MMKRSTAFLQGGRAKKLLSLSLVVVLLITALGPVLSPVFRAAALDKQTIQKILPAVAQIWWLVEEEDGLYGAGMGSGTILSADGLILTNAHVAFPDEPGVDYLGVALTVRSDQPPQPAYIAEVVAADRALDLAVLRIVSKLDNSPVTPSSLKLPFVPLGDSDGLEVGDELDIFGYPGIGGETVTFTKGVVSGFSLESGITGRAWIKTDTTIAGGNSGGTAVDQNGFLVGVPTQAGAGSGDSTVDCRPVADTNRDGTVDDGDTCVPIGGFINALRPVSLAKPIIEAARLGLNPQAPAPSRPDAIPAGRARIYNLLFSSGVSETDQPTAIIATLPSGADELYLFFDYENIASTSTIEVRGAINNQESDDLSWSSGQWGGGPAGTWWVGWTFDDLPDGTFKAAIYLDGKQAASAQIPIGGKAQSLPAFENVVFAKDATAQDEPVDAGVLFPAGITSLVALFDYKNMARDTEWTRTWLLDDEVVLTKTEKWTEDRQGRYLLELTHPDGLPAGNWRLELSIQGNLAAVGSFRVAGGQGKGVSFDPIVFASDVDRRGQPVGSAKSFASGLEALFAFSDYDGMEDGLNVVVRWAIDGQMVAESPYTWQDGESGTWYGSLSANQGALPDGQYDIELEVEGQVVQAGTTTVGAGARPRPTPTPASDNGVQGQGIISDLDSGQPIPGAIFLVLMPGITFDAFEWTDAEIYTAAEADQYGAFELPLPLERGECYTMIVGAEGYWLYAEDDVCIGANAPAVLDLDVQLERK
jgi:S1-C subfamily serine protease